MSLQELSALCIALSCIAAVCVGAVLVVLHRTGCRITSGIYEISQQIPMEGTGANENVPIHPNHQEEHFECQLLSTHSNHQEEHFESQLLWTHSNHQEEYFERPLSCIAAVCVGALLVVLHRTGCRITSGIYEISQQIPMEGTGANENVPPDDVGESIATDPNHQEEHFESLLLSTHPNHQEEHFESQLLSIHTNYREEHFERPLLSIHTHYQEEHCCYNTKYSHIVLILTQILLYGCFQKSDDFSCCEISEKSWFQIYFNNH
jgi:hypothetical protein